MRFLTVSPYRRGHGAYERQRRMAAALAAAGHEVLWLAPGLDKPAAEHFLPLPDSRLPSVSGWVARVRAGVERHAARLGEIDAVFTVSEYDALACLSHRRIAAVPHVFFQRGDTIECERFHARHARRVRHRLKSRVLLGYYPLLQRHLMRRMAGVVVQAEFLGELLARRCPDMTCPVTVLPNDCRFTWRPDSCSAELDAQLRAFKGDSLLVGMVAQAFWAGKGFDVFFAALERLHGQAGIRAAILAYGEDEALIRRAVAERGLEDSVLFPGRADAAHQVMHLFDLVAVPTRFLDACPNVVLEALHAGTAILASDIPAHRAQLAHPELLFASGDARALAEGILRLQDPAARDANRALAAERRRLLDFDWDARVVAILEGYATAGGTT